MENLNEMLKRRRIELGLSLEEVGKIVGVGKSTVRKWETGMIKDMKRSQIAKYAKALRVKPTLILGIEDEKPSPTFSDDIIKLIKKYEALSPEHKKQVSQQIDYYLSIDK